MAKNVIVLPKKIKQTNAGQECDMLVGPCACGAWHHKPKRLTIKRGIYGGKYHK